MEIQTKRKYGLLYYDGIRIKSFCTGRLELYFYLPSKKFSNAEIFSAECFTLFICLFIYFNAAERSYIRAGTFFIFSKNHFAWFFAAGATMNMTASLLLGVFTMYDLAVSHIYYIT